jgi:ribulose-5-phosphate 4-epimerase/fuculose-1-phosphate aldolase
MSGEEWRLRVDLSAAFRLAAMMNWHEGVANHFSVAISDNGKKFLVNPKGKHFSRLRASDLLLVDSDDQASMSGPESPDVTAWCIHAAMHANIPQARCVMHLHPPYATVVATLKDPEIKPIEQNTARFYKRIAYDLGYGGMALTTDEGHRLADVLGEKSTLMMGNHGVLVAAPSVPVAFDEMYYLERACQTLVRAYSTGQPLNLMTPTAAEQTARDWGEFGDLAAAHFEELRRHLDETDPSYAK